MKPYFTFLPLLVVFTEQSRQSEYEAAKKALFHSNAASNTQSVDVRVAYRTDSESSSSNQKTFALEDIAARSVFAYPEAISLVLGNLAWAQEEDKAGQRLFIQSAVRLLTTVGLPCIPTLEWIPHRSDNTERRVWHFSPFQEDAASEVARHMKDAVTNLYRAVPTLGAEPLVFSTTGLHEKAQRDATIEMLAAVRAPALLDVRSAELDALQRLLLPISPTARGMRFVKCLNSGKSGAKVAVLKIDDEASVIVKIGSPLALHSELYGYSTVMNRKLRTGVGANALYGQGRNGLVLTQVLRDDGELDDRESDKPWVGLLAYSLAGPPGVNFDLQSLGDRLKTALKDSKKRNALLGDLDHTLSTTIAVLHQGARVERRTIWQSFGQVLPPLLAVSVDSSKESAGTPALLAFVEGEDKSWLAADAAQFRAAKAMAERESGTLLRLQRMSLHDLDAPQQSAKRHSAQLRHPRLGMRIQVQFVPRFQPRRHEPPDAPEITSDATPWANAPWLRRGCRFDVVGYAMQLKDAIHHDDLKALWDAAERPAGEEQAWGARHVLMTGTSPAEAPQSHLGVGRADRLLDITFKTAIGSIQGDLNLENIMFSAHDKTGWLIDFEHSRNDGCIAYDYAKLIVETIAHYLLPQIDVLCKMVAGSSQDARAKRTIFLSWAQQLLETVADAMAVDIDRGQLSTLAKTKIDLIAQKGPDKDRPPLPIDEYDEPTVPGGIAFTLEVLATMLRAARRTLASSYPRDDSELAFRDLARAVGAYAFAAKKFKKGASLQHHRHALEMFATHCFTIGIPGLASHMADTLERMERTTHDGAKRKVPIARDAHAFLLHWLGVQRVSDNAPHANKQSSECDAPDSAAAVQNESAAPQAQFTGTTE